MKFQEWVSEYESKTQTLKAAENTYKGAGLALSQFLSETVSINTSEPIEPLSIAKMIEKVILMVEEK